MDECKWRSHLWNAAWSVQIAWLGKMHTERYTRGSTFIPSCVQLAFQWCVAIIRVFEYPFPCLAISRSPKEHSSCQSRWRCSDDPGSFKCTWHYLQYHCSWLKRETWYYGAPFDQNRFWNLCSFFTGAAVIGSRQCSYLLYNGWKHSNRELVAV